MPSVRGRPPDHFLVAAFLAACLVFLFGLFCRVLPWLPLNRLPFSVRLSPLPTFYLDFLDESLKPGNFYSDFQSISRPEWRSVVLEGYREPHNLRFTIRLDLRGLQENTAADTET